MDPIEVIEGEFSHQHGEDIHRLISVPPETGSSFTALLELPANQAMELLVHSSEHGVAENPSMTLKPDDGEQFGQCPPPPPAAVLIFPSGTALVDRAAKFSCLVNSDNNSRENLETVKQEPVDSDSNPNSHSSPAVSNPAAYQNPKSTKRKDREKTAKESNKKSKKPANETSKDGGELPYIHVRVRRGQATDSHSLAERARREKINARMKLLQELVPGCNKISGTAMVLEEIINHVQSLQRQVEFLSMKLATVNTSVDFNFNTLLAAESASQIETNFQDMVTPSMWPEEQVYQQLCHLDGIHQPVWGREEDNSNFITPENSLLSYDSSANSASLRSKLLKMEL
ncbi:hypothetical protein ACH5RR_002689 [Cinchona calisaya]|uniref:BHLH domain-containing protein n=1 Tax=Cinchona calisaya TaxID=153742 RepID=A0ABD3AT15_9GENT